MRAIYACFWVFGVLVHFSTLGWSESSKVDQSGPEIQKWCSDLRTSIKILKWDVDPCSGVSWKVDGSSVEGRSLVYAEFGNPEAENVTLILSMVHGDEVTPLYVALQLVHWLKDKKPDLSQTRVVVAPLVNPDGFFKTPRSRVNARGVDINRNFATQDWDTLALANWKKKI